jgi:hypothetical protein
MFTVAILSIFWIALILGILPKVLAHPHAVQPLPLKQRFNRPEARGPDSQKPGASTQA